MNIGNLVVGLIKAVFTVEEFNLDIVLTDKRNVVICERHCLLQYCLGNLTSLKKEIDSIGRDGHEIKK